YAFQLQERGRIAILFLRAKDGRRVSAVPLWQRKATNASELGDRRRIARRGRWTAQHERASIRVRGQAPRGKTRLRERDGIPTVTQVLHDGLAAPRDVQRVVMTNRAIRWSGRICVRQLREERDHSPRRARRHDLLLLPIP